MPINKLPRGVAIVGAGMSKFGAFPEKNSRDLFVEAYKTMSASVDKGFDPAVKKGKPAPNWASTWDFLHDESGNPMIAWPLRLFDCSPVSDGAATVLLVAAERAHEFSDHPIHIIGSGQASDAALHDRPELTTLPAAKKAAADAYSMAGVTAKDIRIAEVHDCFTIAEVIASEDIWFLCAGRRLQSRRRWRDCSQRLQADQYVRRPEGQRAPGGSVWHGPGF